MNTSDYLGKEIPVVAEGVVLKNYPYFWALEDTNGIFCCPVTTSDGNEELAMPTGYLLVKGPESAGDLWLEFEDSNGDCHYLR